MAKSHFHSGGQARIGRPKIPLGSGSFEASPIIRYKDAIKARCVFLRVATNALFMAFLVVHDVCYVKGR